MADLNLPVADQPSGSDRVARAEPIWNVIELLFFAYRDFIGDPDDVLAKLRFGRAHHRVLHFVNRNPGMKVAELLDVLKITKQSLGRVLKQLIQQGYIVQQEGAHDRRQRLLYVTPKGEALAMKLAGLQTTRIAEALSELGPNGHEMACRFLTAMVNGEHRESVLRFIRSSGPGAPVPIGTDTRAMSRITATLPDDAPHLLVVDDDRRIRDLLSRFLFAEGYRVTTADTAADARAKLEGLRFDLLILDVMMPGETGFSLARDLRAYSNVPIIMLTARAEANSRIEGLAIGADDYLGKPFEPKELSLRIASILRRSRAAPTPPLETVRFGDFQFHLSRGELKRGEELIRLTDREREMLRLLAERPGETVPRQSLAGQGGSIGERAVDVQINRLRRKIERDSANPLFVQTVRGIGYRLVTAP